MESENTSPLPGCSLDDYITPNGTVPVRMPTELILSKLLRAVQLKLLDTDEKKDAVASLLTSNHPLKQLSAAFALFELGIKKLTFIDADKNLRYLTFKVRETEKEDNVLISVLSTDHKGNAQDFLSGIKQANGNYISESDEEFYNKTWMKKVGMKSYLTGMQFKANSEYDNTHFPKLAVELFEAFLMEEMEKSFSSPSSEVSVLEETKETTSSGEDINKLEWAEIDNLELALENMAAEQREAYIIGKSHSRKNLSEIYILDQTEKQKYEFYKRVYADLVTASFLGTDGGEQFILKQEFCIIHGKNSLPHRLLERIGSVEANTALMKAVEFVYSMSEEDILLASSETPGKELRDSIERTLFAFLSDTDAEVILGMYDKKVGLSNIDEWSLDNAEIDETLTFQNTVDQSQMNDWTGLFEDGQAMLEAVANLNSEDQKRFKNNDSGFKYEIFKQIRNSRIMTRQQRETAVRILNRLDLPAPEGGLRTELQDDLVILNGRESSSQ